MGEWRKNVGERAGVWIVVMAIMAGGLGACATVEPAPAIVVPKAVAECPDPKGRKRLGEGDTYRDLARAHATAVAGWQRCSDAARINAS